MRRWTKITTAGLVGTLLLVSSSAAPVSATGKGDTSLDVCVAGKHQAGVKVFSKDGGAGAGRVLCVDRRWTFQVDPWEESWGGTRKDRHLDDRNPLKSPRQDIWRRMDKNIESIEVIARQDPVTPGEAWCSTSVQLFNKDRSRPWIPIFEAQVAGEEATPGRKLFEIPENRDNKATRIKVSYRCDEDRFCLYFPDLCRP